MSSWFEDFFRQRCLWWARERLSHYPSPAAVAADLAAINAYPNLSRLGPPRDILSLESWPDRANLLEMGRELVLAGRVFWEHAAAGEGTRLGLGPKFFIQPTDLDPAWDSVDLCLGLRRLARLIFDLGHLARAVGLDPALVLARQRIMVVAAEETVERVARLVLETFSALIPARNWLFMAQLALPGLNRAPGQAWVFDPNSPKRLYNHGAMAWQKVMADQIFWREEPTGPKRFLSQGEFFQLLGEFDDLVSLNVEDLDYLAGALDLEALGLAARLGQKGFGVVMEIVGNNPERPIKGGMCAFDEILGRDVVIESFRLKGLEPRDIQYLNKNFNHYPRPAWVFAQLRDLGLFLPAAVHDERLYFQPVQGDLNFLVPTAFFSRQDKRGINSLKSPKDVPAALAALRAQDAEPGFLTFLKSLPPRLA
ncbi:MAG: hypothetical protein LBR11_05880 [Deltaproteobacteria bacterium]|nr:hypothetical protein [Deltaproteobacteria bacterium]